MVRTGGSVVKFHDFLATNISVKMWNISKAGLDIFRKYHEF